MAKKRGREIMKPVAEALKMAGIAPDKVNDVVIEFGNPLYQSTLDSYIAGEEVPFEQVSLVWRNTVKVGSWDSPIYQHFLEAVRRVNKGLPADRKLRVVAGDSAIDWKKVHSRSDWGRFLPNDPWFASAIKRELAAKDAATEKEAERDFEKALAYERAGEGALARSYYRVAARKSTGEIKEKSLQRLAALAAKSTTKSR